MTFQIKSKPTGLAAKLAAHKSASTVAEGAELAATPKPPSAPITYLAVTDPAIKDKIGIVFDDSGSMSGSAIQEAKDGVIEFLRSCIPNTTAIAIYPMNAPAIRLDTDLPKLAAQVLTIKATDYTPLVETTIRLIEQTNGITRGVVFSDGSPDSKDTGHLVGLCKLRNVPLDTCYIGSENNQYAIDFMRKLAEDTGGTFIHLKPGVSIRNTFKYLAPAYRAMLADKSFVNKLERGQV